jgi:hypothetical protein
MRCLLCIKPVRILIKYCRRALNYFFFTNSCSCFMENVERIFHVLTLPDCPYMHACTLYSCVPSGLYNTIKGACTTHNTQTSQRRSLRHKKYVPLFLRVGRVVQSLATGWTIRGSNPGWARDFPHLPNPALGPTQPPVQWVLFFFPGVKSSRGVTLTPHPLLVPLVMKE